MSNAYTPQVVPCLGGLDLTTDVLNVNPGTLADCENYEIIDPSGYRRVNGIEAYDGKIPSYLEDWAVLETTTSVATGTADRGAALHYTKDGEEVVFGYILDKEVDGTDVVLHFIVTDPNLIPPINTTVTADTSLSITWQGSSLNIQKASEYYSTAALFIAARNGFFTSGQSDATSPYPYSTTLNDHWLPTPHGLHYFKDEVYAIIDYFPLAFDSGGYEVVPGDVIKISTSDDNYTVIDVRVSSGEWGDDDASGVILLSGVNSATNPFADNDQIDLVYPDASVEADVMTVRVTTASDPLPWHAGIKRDKGFIDDTGTPDQYNWEDVELGWELTFDETDVSGLTAIPRVDRTTTTAELTPEAQTTGAIFPTAFAAGTWGTLWRDNTGASNADINDINADDTAYARQVFTTNPQGFPFYATNYSFGLPTDSIIIGVTVEVDAALFDADSSATCKFQVKLYGVDGSQAKQTADIPRETATDPIPQGTFQTFTLGGENDLWGLSTLSATDVNDTGFGIEVKPIFAGSPTVADFAAVNFVRVTVHYTTPGRQLYAWNGSTDVQFVVANYIVKDGTFATSDASGVIHVYNVLPYESDNRRRINTGDQIRTAPDGGGICYGSFTSEMAPVALPSKDAMVSADRRFRIITSNFFAKEDYDAFYGTSGLGPAFGYDGIYFYKIYTLLASENEVPSHVGVHANHLMLGYPSGYVQMSAAGFPLSFDPNDTFYGGISTYTGDVTDFSFPSKVTGMQPLSGQAFMVGCQDSIHAITGTVGGVDGNTSTQVISPAIGLIEFTLVDMGFPVYLDYRGINTVSVSEKYGDFENSRLSFQISPFIRARSQARFIHNFNEHKVLEAIPVKNKNQYRLYYRDGTVLTMALVGPERQPQFTKQKLRAGADSDSYTATYYPQALCYGVDTRGVDRIFGSFTLFQFTLTAGSAFPDAVSVNVYELDRGDLMFGDTFPASIDMNWNFFDNPFDYNTLRKIRTHFQSHNHFDLDISFAVDEGDVTTDSVNALLDNSALPYAPTLRARSVMNDVAVHGRTMKIKYSSDGANVPSHVIQALMLQYIKGRGDV